MHKLRTIEMNRLSVEEFKEFGLEIRGLSYDLHHSNYRNEVQTE